jgi:uncharacterized surface anchored protein
VKDFIAPAPLNLNTCGAIEITKTRKHAAAGPGPHPHAGVTFTVTGPGLPAAGTTVVTDAQGQACLGGLVAGNYTVTETVPSGYQADGATSKPVTVDSVGTCQSGAETAGFSNTPLTNITISVDSQIDGGTASTIDCGGGATGSTGATGDGSVSRNNLPPGTYTCTVVVDP